MFYPLHVYRLYFFQDFEVVRVRLIVDQSGKHMGCGYFEFASANEAEKVSSFYSNDEN